jgi:hypothetical protein
VVLTLVCILLRSKGSDIVVQSSLRSAEAGMVLQVPGCIGATTEYWLFLVVESFW